MAKSVRRSPWADPGDRVGFETLALAFANTAPCPACHADDDLAAADRFADWSRRHAVPTDGSLSTDELDHLRDFRTGVTAVLRAAVDGSRPPRASLNELNQAARVSDDSELSWAKGAFVLRRIVPRVSRLSRVKSVVAASAVFLLTGPSRDRLRACQGRGCAHLVLARTRTQVWCSSAGCGNRARVARHYWRERRKPTRRGRRRAAG